MLVLYPSILGFIFLSIPILNKALKSREVRPFPLPGLTRNAAVLPLPVCAEHIMSRPDANGGMEERMVGNPEDWLTWLIVKDNNSL